MIITDHYINFVNYNVELYGCDGVQEFEFIIPIMNITAIIFSDYDDILNHIVWIMNNPEKKPERKPRPKYYTSVSGMISILNLNGAKTGKEFYNSIKEYLITNERKIKDGSEVSKN